MRRLKIAHVTTYEYAASVALQGHKLLLRPREGHDIRIAASRLDITPASQVKWHRDVYGNSVATVTFSEMASRLVIASEVVIEHYEDAPLDFLLDDYAINFPFQYDPTERPDLVPYQMPSFPKDEPALRQWLAQFWRPGQMVATYGLLDSINRAIPQSFGYQMREEPGVQSPTETLTKASGSCRDFATVFIEACRFFGLAARFVSGYLHCPATEAGHGSTHAWSEVYLPGAGWKGFDSTSGEVVGGRHIAVAVSRHPEAIPPVSGTFVGPPGALSVMAVDVQVAPI